MTENSAVALIGSKIGSMVLFVVVGIVGALLPVHLHKLKMNKLMSLCNAFAGGAFLSLGIFHILPESLKDLEESNVLMDIGHQKFNAAFVFVFVGYIIILFSEKVLFDPTSLMGEGSYPQSSVVLEVREYGNVDSLETTVENEERLKKMIIEEEVQGANERDTCLYMFKSGAFCLMLALTIHGLFEGIVVGTVEEVPRVLMITLVIFGHKWAESFALMSQFLEQKVGKRIIWSLMSAFILSSPIGVGIGIGLSKQGQAASGICNALGAGTVLYVANEISSDVFSEGGKCRIRYLKFFVYICGLLVVFGMTMLEVFVQ